VKWLGLLVLSLVLAGYLVSLYRVIGWEGPSDWSVTLGPGQLSISMPNPGRAHFRGAYGRGWWTEAAYDSVGWTTGDSVDYGPFSVMDYPLWVPLLLAGLATLMAWKPAFLPKRATVRWLFTGSSILGCATPWLLIVTALPAAVMWWPEIPAARRRSRLHAGLCPACGYDRRGLSAPDAPCPECGSAPARDTAGQQP
jgi:hypothetical protein